MSQDFDRFFATAMGTPDALPYGFQRRIAEHGLPDVLVAPTGAGKTAAVVLPWLWRRREDPTPAVRAATPRRLILTLPMRTLVDQVAGEVERWLDRLGLHNETVLHVAMGGRLGTQHEWRVSPHRDAIVVGTTDIVVSKLLNRAYGTSRNTYPLDFALATNGSHVVLDEIQLAPESTSTLRQVTAFARQLGTAEPFGLTCMSATLSDIALDTVDNPWPGSASVVRLGDGDHTGELGRRRAARREVSRLAVEPGDSRALALAVLAAHRPGTRTLVVLNTVRAAVELARALDRESPPADRALVHSRFRPVERAARTAELLAPVDPAGPGLIAVATQAVEAGIDIDSATLVTEAAPWPSLCQRAGRCNRYARYGDARLLWLAPKRALPYEECDVAATVAALEQLDGQQVTSEELLNREVAVSDPQLSILRRPDFLSLFDTAPDLDGSDVDISPYVRDADEMDVQVAWLDLDAKAGPPAGTPLPDPAWRCAVPVGQVRDLAKRATVWRFDVHADRWEPVRQETPPRPGEVLVAVASAGGYNPRFGLDAASTAPVSPLEATSAAGAREDTAGFAVDSRSAEPGSVDQPDWLELDVHLEETAEQAAALIRAMVPEVDNRALATTVAAARLHDIGKIQPDWQRALRSLACDGDRPPDGLLAKSPGRGRLGLPQERAGFRHELLSALLVAELSLGPLVNGTEDRDLLRYLVAAHHGRIRVQARDSGEPSADRLLGLRDGEEVVSATVLGADTPCLRVDLAEFRLGGEASWTRSALALRARFGPFRLAYLEMLVRVADWRASGRRPVPAEVVTA